MPITFCRHEQGSLDVKMANKARPGSLVRLAPQSQTAPKNDTDDGQSIDDRFRAALRRGETSGDFVVLDDQGNEIVGALPSKSIFDI